jgi:transposase
MTYYAGIDVSLRSVNICVVDDDGELVAETKLSSDVQEIIAYLDELEYSIDIVGLEAGTLAQYLTYGLQSAGFDVVCMEARQVKAALSAMRNKTDKHDAVHIKSMESHHIRMLLTSRRAILDKCIDLENEIRGLFKIFGIKLPPKLGHGSFDRTVRAVIEADEKLSHALLPLLDARLVLYKTFRVLDNRTRHLAWGDELCERLMTAPGVGYVTALTFKAGVDDPSRFKQSRTVAAHFGLTPRRLQSGEMDIEGRISKSGDAEVRRSLYVAANSVLTRSSRWSSLKAWGMKLKKNRGHKKAVVAVARKLAVILHRMWIEETQFQWGTEEAS